MKASRRQALLRTFFVGLLGFGSFGVDATSNSTTSPGYFIGRGVDGSVVPVPLDTCVVDADQNSLMYSCSDDGLEVVETLFDGSISCMANLTVNSVYNLSNADFDCMAEIGFASLDVTSDDNGNNCSLAVAETAVALGVCYYDSDSNVYKKLDCNDTSESIEDRTLITMEFSDSLCLNQVSSSVTEYCQPYGIWFFDNETTMETAYLHLDFCVRLVDTSSDNTSNASTSASTTSFFPMSTTLNSTFASSTNNPLSTFMSSSGSTTSAIDAPEGTTNASNASDAAAANLTSTITGLNFSSTDSMNSTLMSLESSTNSTMGATSVSSSSASSASSTTNMPRETMSTGASTSTSAGTSASTTMSAAMSSTSANAPETSMESDSMQTSTSASEEMSEETTGAPEATNGMTDMTVMDTGVSSTSSRGTEDMGGEGEGSSKKSGSDDDDLSGNAIGIIISASIIAVIIIGGLIYVKMKQDGDGNTSTMKDINTSSPKKGHVKAKSGSIEMP